MGNWIAPIVVFAGLAALVVFLLWRRKSKREDSEWKAQPFDRAMKIVGESQPTLTPLGKQIYFERGTDPSTFILDAVDDGAERTFLKCECAGYPVDRSRHHVKVVSFAAETDSNGDPAYRIYISNNSPYYNTPWDQQQGHGLEVDHYVLAAGQTIAFGNPYGDVMIVPHHNGHAAHLATVVEYEMEHVTLAYYDGQKYEETKYHVTGGHPLIPDCGSLELYEDRRYKSVQWEESRADSCVLLTR